jgi:hypothetical protein
MDFEAIVTELNRRSAGRPIGDLQRLRQQLKGHQRAAGSKLFSRQTTFKEYAFHHGGRSELQFNIGVEPICSSEWLRYGVAFSLEPSQSLPTIEPLRSKIERFNQYVRLYGDDLADCRMWHFSGDIRSEDYLPSAIPDELVRNNVFIFLGKRQVPAALELDDILQDFDRLLPLYRYVESHSQNFPVQTDDTTGLMFEPGCSLKKSATAVILPAQRLNVLLRHNEIQRTVYSILAARHGSTSVGTENITGTGNRVDVVVRLEGAFTYYEIKTDLSARACVRSAIGQLFEYSFWPSATRANHLVVIGEPELDAETRQYLKSLRNDFGIPLYYARYDSSSMELVHYDFAESGPEQRGARV